jgi:hypothetical protein
VAFQKHELDLVVGIIKCKKISSMKINFERADDLRATCVCAMNYGIFMSVNNRYKFSFFFKLSYRNPVVFVIL